MKINRNSETYGVFVYIQHFVAMRCRILESLIDVNVNVNVNVNAGAAEGVGQGG